MGAARSRLGRVVLGATIASALCAQVVSAGPPLRRNLDAFHIFGMRNVDLKNYTLHGACNIGVNCKQPSSNSDCGVETQENVLYADGSQIAADVQKFTKPGAQVWQVFTNNLVSPGNVTVNEPPVELLTPLPILPDADGDGTPSCAVNGGQCVIDVGDLKAACGFPTPFPACDLTKPVIVVPNSDCVIAGDTSLGNNRCDLPPGVYGNISIQDSGKLTFDGPGDYVICSFNAGKDIEVIADANVTINMTGDMNINNNSRLGAAAGTNCGQIVFNVDGPGQFGFGRNSSINGYFCAPERILRVGHDNNLTGRYFGDTVLADSNDDGFCCAEGGDCACFNSFSPSVISSGSTLTILGSCSLVAVTRVDFYCNGSAVPSASANPPFLSQAADKIELAMPAIPGALPQSCTVKVVSSSGTFTGNGTLTVN